MPAVAVVTLNMSSTDLPHVSRTSAGGTTETMVAETTQKMLNRCENITYDYEIAPAIIIASCFVFGLMYTFFGYRFFKAVMFLTGFAVGGLLTFVLLDEYSGLPVEGNAGIAVGVGIICGLITMLVQYVGLFLTGLTFGLFLAAVILVIVEFFVHIENRWISIGIMIGLGTIFAVVALRFQKSLTILQTSVFGAALMLACLDYFVEMFMMVTYVLERLKVEYSAPVCWFSWIILGTWPLIFSIGAIIQWKITSQGFNHHELTKSRRKKKIHLARIRARERKMAATREERGEATTVGAELRQDRNNRYRHLYQIRRSNGDVISKAFIESIHHKLSPGLRSLTGTESEAGDTLPPPDSTQTTLTQLS